MWHAAGTGAGGHNGLQQKPVQLNKVLTQSKISILSNFISLVYLIIDNLSVISQISFTLNDQINFMCHVICYGFLKLNLRMSSYEG